jgi:D-alanyl-D-alanine carboxypeptidase
MRKKSRSIKERKKRNIYYVYGAIFLSIATLFIITAFVKGLVVDSKGEPAASVSEASRLTFVERDLSLEGNDVVRQSEKADQSISESSLVAPSASIPAPDASFQGSAAGVIRTDGSRLFSWERTKRWPIASLTKLLTATVAIETFPENSIIVISETSILPEGNRAELMVGEAFSLDDMITAMMTVSSNDAAEAIAEFTGRDIFVERMNAFAAELGMVNSTFDDPSGLSVYNRSTVEEIELLVQYIWKNHPGVLAKSTRPNASITNLVKNESRTLININAFAGQNDFLGGKTGYLPAAGGNLVSIFARENDIIIVTVFGTHDRFAETRKIMHNL